MKRIFLVFVMAVFFYPAFAQAADLQASEIALMKSKLDCKNVTHVYYCNALDQFSTAQIPQVAGFSTYAGSSLFVDAQGQGKITEEASYLILDPVRVQYDSIIPESEGEKKQTQSYLSYFQRGQLPPASDPLVAFSKSVKFTEAKNFQKIGKSLFYERLLKSYPSPNQIYLRETPNSIIVVEVAGPVSQSKSIFFVGVFSKKMKMNS